MKVQCKGRTIASEPACESLLYVATSSLGPFWTDITSAEWNEIKRLGIKPSGVARFLGIHFPK